MKRFFALMLLFAAACGGTEDANGPEVVPHVSPVQLGDFWPQGNTDPDYGNNERTPYEWVLLLQSVGDEPVKVSKACLVGDASNFIIEGPVPTTIPAGDEGAIRLTYGRNNPGSDRVAVVVRSNAKNFPTLVVPLCASVVADGADKNKAVQPCEFPESDIPADPCN
ncbi:MAG: hypothetical protein R3E66_09265 [bacterium]